MAETLTDAIAAYIEGRKLAKLEPEQKKLDKALLKEGEQPLAAQAEFNEKKAQLDAQYTPAVWLGDAAKRAKQISLATHSAKFIHSDAKASSVLHLAYMPDSPFLASHCLPHKTLDAAGNAAALDVARLLKLDVNGSSLVDELRAGHVTSLEAFSRNTEDHIAWLEGFAQALRNQKVTGHTLAKQVYFPVEAGYHLIIPLYASSLVQNYHTKITETRFTENAKNIRDAKRKGQFADALEVSYPKTLEQSFGGSKPQNISQLNSERYGKHYLLPCMPPNWQSIHQPPANQKTLFNKGLAYALRDHMREFKRFLETLRPDQKNINTRLRRDNEYLQPIIDAVFEQAAQIQSLETHAGWSLDTDCILQPAFCLWLDVWCDDGRFIRERNKQDWQVIVTKEFARWLNSQLKSEHYTLGDKDFKHWQKQFSEQLKHFDWATPTATNNTILQVQL